MSSDKSLIEVHKLVAASKKKDGSLTNLAEYVGFVIESTSEYVKLCPDLNFNSHYYKIPSNAIRDRQVVDDNPDKPTRLLVDGDANVEFVKMKSLSGPASFVSGEIAEKELKSESFRESSQVINPTAFRGPPICGIPTLEVCPPSYRDPVACEFAARMMYYVGPSNPNPRGPRCIPSLEVKC